MQNMRRETLGTLQFVPADYCVTCGKEIEAGRGHLLAPGYLGFNGCHCCCIDCFTRAEAHCERQAERWEAASKPSASSDGSAETVADDNAIHIAGDLVPPSIDP